MTKDEEIRQPALIHPDQVIVVRSSKKARLGSGYYQTSEQQRYGIVELSPHSDKELGRFAQLELLDYQVVLHLDDFTIVRTVFHHYRTWLNANDVQATLPGTRTKADKLLVYFDKEFLLWFLQQQVDQAEWIKQNSIEIEQFSAILKRINDTNGELFDLIRWPQNNEPFAVETHQAVTDVKQLLDRHVATLSSSEAQQRVQKHETAHYIELEILADGAFNELAQLAKHYHDYLVINTLINKNKRLDHLPGLLKLLQNVRYLSEINKGLSEARAIIFELATDSTITRTTILESRWFTSRVAYLLSNYKVKRGIAPISSFCSELFAVPQSSCPQVEEHLTGTIVILFAGKLIGDINRSSLDLSVLGKQPKEAETYIMQQISYFAEHPEIIELIDPSLLLTQLEIKMAHIGLTMLDLIDKCQQLNSSRIIQKYLGRDRNWQEINNLASANSSQIRQKLTHFLSSFQEHQ